MLRIIILLSVFSLSVSAQISQTVYYNNKNLDREVRKEKAKYAVTTTINADSSRTIEIINVRDSIIERSQTMKGYEPVGIWKHLREDRVVLELDYNFKVEYSDDICIDSLPFYQWNYLVDETTMNYIAPKLATGETTWQAFFRNRSAYTEMALERGIEGSTAINFRINKEGEVKDLAIVKKTNPWIEKEALRIFKQLKFLNPPMLNGTPVEFCRTVPVNFEIKSGALIIIIPPLIIFTDKY
jgi:TonB family protein